MIDRENRDLISQLIRDYISLIIDASTFEDQVSAISEDSEDEIIRDYFSGIFFDDFKKFPKEGPSREDVQYWNRLLLMLESNYEMETIYGDRCWTWSHGLALLSFIGSIWFVWHNSWENWCVTALPFGLAVILIAFLRRFAESSNDSEKQIDDQEVYPFPDFQSLAGARRKNLLYEKLPLPRMKKKSLYDEASFFLDKVLNPFFVFLSAIAVFLICGVLSPFVLFLMSIPFRESKTIFKMPDAEPIEI